MKSYLAFALILFAAVLSVISIPLSVESSGQAPPRASAAPLAFLQLTLRPSMPTPEEIVGDEPFAISRIDHVIRDGSGDDFKAVGVLKKGTKVLLVGRSLLRLEGRNLTIEWLKHERGWSRTANLEIHGALPRLPVALPSFGVQGAKTFAPPRTYIAPRIMPITMVIRQLPVLPRALSTPLRIRGFTPSIVPFRCAPNPWYPGVCDPR